MAKTPPGQEDDNPLSKQDEAKESAQMGYFTKLKMGYNKFAAALKSREGERAALQAIRPMKNTPHDILATGSTRSSAGPATAVTSGVTDGDEGGDQTGGNAGDTGTTTQGDGGGGGQSGSGDSGGGPALAPDAGYVSFADTATVEGQDNTQKAKKNDQTLDSIKQVEAQQAKAEGPKATDKKADQTAKPGSAPAAPVAAAKGSAPTTAGPKGGASPGLG